MKGIALRANLDSLVVRGVIPGKDQPIFWKITQGRLTTCSGKKAFIATSLIWIFP